MDETKDVVVLMDNGSLRAASTVQLRLLAKGLERVLGQRVYPVSLLYSSKIPVEELGGEPAQTFVPFLRIMRERGKSEFTIVPLFFGPSGALSDYLPERLNALKTEGWRELEVKVAPPLVQDGDFTVADIMADLIQMKMGQLGWKSASVAMCDHGTPAKAVNDVRELVAQQLAEVLEKKCDLVMACSMERREGKEYDFNEPLLENLLGSEGFDERVIVSMLFASPGRHAGDNGDVAAICSAAERANASLEVAMTDLVGSKVEELVAILAERYRSARGVKGGCISWSG